jgi:hypothetical protein
MLADRLNHDVKLWERLQRMVLNSKYGKVDGDVKLIDQLLADK